MKTHPVILLCDRNLRPIISCMLFAAALTGPATPASAQASAWQTVDDISPSCAAFGIHADAAGNIFAAGYLRDSSNIYHGVIMKSSDAGQSWDSDPATPDVDEPADALPPGYGTSAGSSFESVSSATVAIPDGSESQVVALGKIVGAPGASARWIVRRSRDGGVTWQTIDDYQHPTFWLSALLPNLRSGYTISINASGTVFTTGLAEERIVTTKGKTTTTTTISHWLVRKGVPLADGTMQWTTSDFTVPTTSYSMQKNVYPSAVACVGGDAYVAGGGGPEGASWIVMKSANGGPWTTVDSYRLDSRWESHAYAIAADSAGNLYVAGHGTNVTQNTGWAHWIVRKASPGGTNWTTVDNFRYAGAHGWARSVVVAPNGDVHVTGFGGFRPQHWISRRRSAATGQWETSDDYQHPVNVRTYGNAVAVDPAGNVFASGFAATPPDSDVFTLQNWLVRRMPAP